MRRNLDVVRKLLLHLEALQDAGVKLDNAAGWLRDQELVQALRQTKAGRGTALPPDVWRRLPELLACARTYLDPQELAPVYEIAAGGEIGKVAVRVNYSATGWFHGERKRVRSNFIRSAGLVEDYNLREPRYVLLGEV